MEAFLNRHHIKEQIIAVGVSGGADSLALVLQANEALKPFGRRIIAVTVDHGLRPVSHQEAEYVAELMQKFGIEHHILTWQGEKPTTGIEESARTARYNLIAEWCDANHIKVLMTAHHLRDQTETFFMRLQRGSGLEGLCCMREVSKWKNLTILRPLLHTRPETLESYLKERNIQWVHDNSNDDSAFLRVRMRQFLPELQRQTQITPERIDEAVTNLQSAENFIEDTIDTLFQTAIKTYENSVYYVKYTDYLRWHPEIKFRIISRLCRRGYSPRADSVLNLIAALNKLPFTGATLGNREIFLAYEKVWIVPEHNSKHHPLRKRWKDFIVCNPEYANQKIPYKAKLTILGKTGS